MEIDQKHSACVRIVPRTKNKGMESKTNLQTRQEVFAAVDGELEYQLAKFGENPHEIDAFATYIRQYSKILDETATAPNSPEVKLVVVRKIAAIAIRCMEQHGAPNRGN